MTSEYEAVTVLEKAESPLSPEDGEKITFQVDLTTVIPQDYSRPAPNFNFNINDQIATGTGNHFEKEP